MSDQPAAPKRNEMASFRLPADVVTALKTLTDVLRKGALMVLGKCPTCGRDITD
jgi:hypothetical protein